MENKTKIKSFTDLNTWKEGHKLVLMVYKATTSFPREELYSLVDQMRRCVISITSNIADQTVIVHKLLNGLIKSSHTKYEIPDTRY